MARLLRSSALSLALGYVVLGFVALILFAAPLWYAWRVTLQNGRIEILQDDAQRLTGVFRAGGPDALKNYIDTRINMRIANERLLLLTDAELRPIAGNVAAWPPTVPATPGTFTAQLDFAGISQPATVHVALIGGYRLLIGRDNRMLASLERYFWYGLAAAVGVLCVAGLAIGFMTRSAFNARIHSIRQTVSAIIHGDLQHRLPIEMNDDELNTLARTINGMLEQIEQLVHGVRNVSNSIAHDLRTPLAELRSRLEALSLLRPCAEDTFAEVEGAVADVDRVIRIFDALLRLAEIDAGMRRSGFVAVDLAEIAQTAAEFYEPAAELKSIDLTATSQAAVWISGDPVLLAQALGNLIDNALKYAPEHGSIAVSVERELDGYAQISVTDDGPGIPGAEKGKVLERFYRADASRGTPGVGLGLSLVEAIAKIHGSTVELLDGNPGLRVRIRIPPDTQAESLKPTVPIGAPSARDDPSSTRGSVIAT